MPMLNLQLNISQKLSDYLHEEFTNVQEVEDFVKGVIRKRFKEKRVGEYLELMKSERQIVDEARIRDIIEELE